MTWHNTRTKLRTVRVLILARDLFEDVQKYALGQYPIEACGFLSGRFDGELAKPVRCIMLKNIAESAERFVLDPKECDRVREELQPNEELVGFFHSHAKEPTPSGLDKTNMRFLPLVWLIVGGVGNGVADERACLAFKTNRKEILPVDLKFVPGTSSEFSKLLS